MFLSFKQVNVSWVVTLEMTVIVWERMDQSIQPGVAFHMETKHLFAFRIKRLVSM